MSNSDLLEELRSRELRGGGWSFFGSPQVSLEVTSLASLCLLAERPAEALRLGKLLPGVQLADGSWPAPSLVTGSLRGQRPLPSAH
jgi:hypothetical protein